MTAKKKMFINCVLQTKFFLQNAVLDGHTCLWSCIFLFLHISMVFSVIFSYFHLLVSIVLCVSFILWIFFFYSVNSVKTITAFQRIRTYHILERLLEDFKIQNSPRSLDFYSCVSFFVCGLYGDFGCRVTQYCIVRH